MADLTQDFILNDFRVLFYEFLQINTENNTSIPVYGIYIKNIADVLTGVCQDLQNRYNVIIYDPFKTVDAWFQTNALYNQGDHISFQNLDKLNDLLTDLSNAVDYMNASTYTNPELGTLPGYISRLQYAIQFVTRYIDNVSNNYGNIVCDHSTTSARYGFNDLKIYCGGGLT